MPEPLVSDELCAVLEPMIPMHTPSPKGGRRVLMIAKR